MEVIIDQGSSVTRIREEMMIEVEILQRKLREEKEKNQKRYQKDIKVIQNMGQKLMQLNKELKEEKDKGAEMRSQIMELLALGFEVGDSIPESTDRSLLVRSEMVPIYYKQIRKMEKAIEKFISKVQCEEKEQSEETGIETPEEVRERAKKSAIEGLQRKNESLRLLFGRMNYYTADLMGINEKKINNRMNQIGKILQDQATRLDEMTLDKAESVHEVYVEETRTRWNLNFEANLLLQVVTGQQLPEYI